MNTMTFCEGIIVGLLIAFLCAVINWVIIEAEMRKNHKRLLRGKKEN